MCIECQRGPIRLSHGKQARIQGVAIVSDGGTEEAALLAPLASMPPQPPSRTIDPPFSEVSNWCINLRVNASGRLPLLDNDNIRMHVQQVSFTRFDARIDQPPYMHPPIVRGCGVV